MAGLIAADNISKWINTGINWIKKGVRRGQIKNIDRAVDSHNASAVDKLMRNVEKKRDRRTEAS